MSNIHHVRFSLKSSAIAIAAIFMLPPTASAATVFPLNGLSASDNAYVLYLDHCSVSPIDPTRSPEITRNGDTVTVEIFRVKPAPTDGCSGPSPYTIHHVALGNLAEGFHSFITREYVREIGGTTYARLSEDHYGLESRDTPNPAISGIWHAPGHRGVGVTLTLLPIYEFDEPIATLLLSTLAADGTPTWYFGTGVFEDSRLNLTLTRGGGNETVDVQFHYEGCRMASIQATDASLQFPSGVMALTQLTRILDVAGCEPPRFDIEGDRQ